MLDKLLALLIAPVRWLYLLVWWHWRGWKLSQNLPDLDQFVLIGAPHTTNWDYAHFLAGVATVKRRPYVTVKKELFFPPIGWFLRLFGGIPIDRGAGIGVVDQMVARLEAQKRLILVFTPDGTRSYRDHWKTGFYYVAEAADVPIVMAALNYHDKTVYISEPFYPTGDIEADFEVFQDFYGQYGVAHFPEKANDVRIRRKTASESSATQTEA